jgi:hypothetical protein
VKNKILSIIKRNLSGCTCLSAYDRYVFQKVLKCRTEHVPGMHYYCDNCGRMHRVFKSCKDRMCPVCRGAETVKWTAKREAELLPVSYFLLTFTIPKELRLLFLYNKSLPKGFKKVRFYGFMANHCRKNMLVLCRMLLGLALSCQQETDDKLNDTAFLFWKYFGIDITLCPDCGEGHLVLRTGYTKGG